MSQATDSFEVDQRNHWFRTSSVAKPTAIDVGLFTAAPGETGGGTEVSGGSYARVTRAPLDANWTATSSTNWLTDNAAALTYPAPTGNWGVVTHYAIYFDTVMKIYGTLTTSKTVNNADAAPSFAIGALSVTFA